MTVNPPGSRSGLDSGIQLSPGPWSKMLGVEESRYKDRNMNMNMCFFFGINGDIGYSGRKPAYSGTIYSNPIYLAANMNLRSKTETWNLPDLPLFVVLPAVRFCPYIYIIYIYIILYIYILQVFSCRFAGKKCIIFPACDEQTEAQEETCCSLYSEATGWWRIFSEVTGCQQGLQDVL